MKRIKVVGLCLVAIFALSAVAASGASAAEVGECIKQAKPYKGNFTEKSCQTVSGTKEGKYEFSPGVKPENSAFTAKTKTASLKGAAGTIECKKSASVGTWTGSKSQEQTVTFESCEFKGEVVGECHSAGKGPGIIETNKLDNTIIGEGEPEFQLNEKNEPEFVAPKAGEVWERFRGPGGALTSVQAEYECASIVVIKTEGNLDGVYTPASVNVSSKKTEVEFGEGKGAQGLFSEASISKAPFIPVGKGTETAVGKSKGGAKLVIKS
jgi:hypothetical protein